MPRLKRQPSPNSTRYLLTNKRFMLMQTAKLVSVLGYQMQFVAVGWQVYELTSKPLDLGLMGLSVFAPFLLVSLYAGDVVDRYNRVVVLRLAQLALTFASGLLALNSYLHLTSILPIYGILAVIGAGRAFHGPAMSSILPNIIAKQHFAVGMTWNMTAWNIATIAGPPLGGYLFAWTGGALWVYIAAAALQLMATCCIFFFPKQQIALTRSAQRTRERVVAGLAYVWRNKTLLGAISLDLFAVLLGGTVALLPIYAKDILHVGPSGLGSLRAAPSIGAAAMAIFLTFCPMQSKAGRRMLIATGIFGFAICVFGLSTNFMLSFIALLITGAADMISVVVRQTLVQLKTPDEMRGRVSAVNQVFIGASNELGEFESGVSAALLGVVPSVILGGILTCIVTVIWAKMFPSLKQMDALE